jgi:GTP-binding protein
VVNKIDRPGSDPEKVIDMVFELFDNLGATDEQLDFPIIYASALNGYAGTEDTVREGDMTPLFEAIVEHTPVPKADVEGTFQMQVSSLDYNSYVGVMGIGRITRGVVTKNMPVTIVGDDGKTRNGKMQQIFGYHGLDRVEVDRAQAGDIIVFTGLDPLNISDTICDPAAVEALPPLTIDEPTVTMTFQVNTSPFSGQEGKYVTSRQIRDRLEQELLHNVALRVEPMDDQDKFRVSGRGELHLGVLIESMRREGYELAVSRPEVVMKEVDGEMLEPYEEVTVDVEEQHQGVTMERLGMRKAELKNMQLDGKGRVRLDFVMPSRGLIGFQTEFMTITSGSGLIYHSFDHYGPKFNGTVGERTNGVMIASAQGKALAYALFNLQNRGSLMLGHAEEVYEGMVIGIHSRENDLTVNPLKAKQLNNIRAAGTDENLVLTTPIRHTLEQALEFIDDDELVEVTPESIRIRKKFLKENERKRETRKA